MKIHKIKRYLYVLILLFALGCAEASHEQPPEPTSELEEVSFTNPPAFVAVRYDIRLFQEKKGKLIELPLIETNNEYREISAQKTHGFIKNEDLIVSGHTRRYFIYGQEDILKRVLDYFVKETEKINVLDFQKDLVLHSPPTEKLDTVMSIINKAVAAQKTTSVKNSKYIGIQLVSFKAKDKKLGIVLNIHPIKGDWIKTRYSEADKRKIFKDISIIIDQGRADEVEIKQPRLRSEKKIVSSANKTFHIWSPIGALVACKDPDDYRELPRYHMPFIGWVGEDLFAVAFESSLVWPKAKQVTFEREIMDQVIYLERDSGKLVVLPEKTKKD